MHSKIPTPGPHPLSCMLLLVPTPQVELTSSLHTKSENIVENRSSAAHLQ